MNFFDRPDYRINKILLSTLGHWPYQTTRTKYTILITIVFIVGTQMFTKICAILTSFDDIDIVLESLAPFLGDIMASIKFTNSAMKTDEMRVLLERIQLDFSTCSTDDELKILKQFAENGRKLTIIYAGFLYSVMVIFMVAPMKPFIFNTINSTDDRPFVHHTEYFVDSQKYYYPIILHSYMTIVICVSIVVTIDSTFMTLVQHACALFTALGHQLYHLVEDDSITFDVNPHIDNDKSYKRILKCIYKHKKAIEFAALIESYYSTSLFAQGGLSAIAMSASGLQAVTYINETAKFLQQVLFSYAQLVHIFFECVNGQRLINHSERMQEYLINLKWYQTSLRSRKVINIMMIRAQFPSTLTAANMFDISMETFSTLLRTSMSYFTVLSSTQ